MAMEERLADLEKWRSQIVGGWKAATAICTVLGLTGAGIGAWALSKASTAIAAVSDQGLKKRAQEAIGAALGREKFPVGAILAYGGPHVPDGWLPCDGRSLLRDKYDLLFRAIGTAWGQGDDVTSFNIPDLRGVFLRGITGNRNDEYVDPDRDTRKSAPGAGGRIMKDAIGSFQMDAAQKHRHLVQLGEVSETDKTSAYHYHGALTAIPATGVNPRSPMMDEGTSSETRPKNAAVAFIIKAE